MSDAEKGDAVLSLWANYDKYETIKNIAESINKPYRTVKIWIYQSNKLSHKVKGYVAITSLANKHSYGLAKYPNSTHHLVFAK